MSFRPHFSKPWKGFKNIFSAGLQNPCADSASLLFGYDWGVLKSREHRGLETRLPGIENGDLEPVKLIHWKLCFWPPAGSSRQHLRPGSEKASYEEGHALNVGVFPKALVHQPSNLFVLFLPLSSLKPAGNYPEYLSLQEGEAGVSLPACHSIMWEGQQHMPL